MMKSIRLLTALMFLFVPGVTAAFGQSGGPANPQAGSEPAFSASNKSFTDVLLIDQDGKSHRLYSVLIKNRIIIVNAMFTTCTSVCPPMNHNMEMIQERLGDRLGRDVVMMSL